MHEFDFKIYHFKASPTQFNFQYKNSSLCIKHPLQFRLYMRLCKNTSMNWGAKNTTIGGKRKGWQIDKMTIVLPKLNYILVVIAVIFMNYNSNLIIDI